MHIVVAYGDELDSWVRSPSPPPVDTARKLRAQTSSLVTEVHERVQILRNRTTKVAEAAAKSRWTGDL